MALGFERAGKEAPPTAPSAINPKSTSTVPTRNHSYPEAGPVRPKPQAVRQARSDASDHEIEELVAREDEWQHRWRALHAGRNSRMPRRNGNFCDDPTPWVKGKSKEGSSETQHHPGVSDDQNIEAGNISANPVSSALFADILGAKSRGRYHPQTGERLVEDAAGYFGDWSWNQERVGPLPTPPASPRTRPADGSQPSAIVQLELMRDEAQRQTEAMRTQRQRSGLLNRLRSPHCRVERCLKKLLRALLELWKILKQTIASCLIIAQISELAHSVGEIFVAGSKKDKLKRARESKRAAKELCRGLKERSTGRMTALLNPI